MGISSTQTISVTVSPAHVVLQVGHSQQFNAVVTGGSGSAVQWMAAGIPGGNAEVGIVSASGLYFAPTNIPSGGGW
jgi:hypothetical protein